MRRWLLVLWLFVSITYGLSSYFLVHYKIQKNDTLYSISLDFGVSPSLILDWNPGLTPWNLKVGQIIIIPQPPGYMYTVQKGDNLDIIAKRFFTTPVLIKEANHLTSDIIYVGQKLFIPESAIGKAFNDEKFFIWPVYGTISSGYGWRIHPITGKYSFHSGIDIAAPTGTPIFAAESGIVEFAGVNGGYGLMVKIKSSSYEHVYGHLSQIDVYEGQYVKKGQLIGRVGSTGLSTGPHLHFEIRVREKAVNPLNYLPSKIWVLKKELVGAGGE
ncbi:peptidoglycan DD-metalloendopeptidase family protein [Thermotoga sp. KOL6]|uniref:peptidoglycan DD-metalloendopeptidase family protein n=1 Tax=Thermotoga sp. KOL6 TaxID=126741 RepID=UPI000C78C340|nr:M23 family metallopeptidase [Thermotoga sp. KOL6]PLV59139.1 peptidoglycan-binding protein [Thermotoga sp. KOL6]